jgi:nitroreductase
MEILESIRNRRSIRKYKDTPIDDEQITVMLECARLAPSGSHTQPWHFIVVRSDELRKQIMEVSHHQKWMLQAPVFIVCVADIQARLKDDYPEKIDERSPEPEVKLIIRDTAIAIEHMVLQAEYMGLATCWIAWFQQKDIRPVLKIPADKYVVAVITIGHADETPKPLQRRSLQELVHKETWGLYMVGD